VNTYRGFCTTTFLTAEVDVAKERIASDVPALKEEHERIVGYSPAITRQAQKRVALVLRFVDRAGAPISIDLHSPGYCHKNAQ